MGWASMDAGKVKVLALLKGASIGKRLSKV